ncbi:MAG: type II toxin-antitoxin system VapB family antitoxin [Solirubrobacterales bacterium]|nr:type II toxin-antitoxin system VapB family antitoxin [Solirubrobacterales bacterium]OJU96051.1 MAG: hypothetical protein BGO23_00510 [Solirubrobacterales bacterium 67-14]
MRTNIVIDQELMAEAQKLAGTKTMKETVDLALREMVDRRSREGILQLWGKYPNWGKFDDELPDL